MTISKKTKLALVICAGFVIFLVAPMVLVKYEYDRPGKDCLLQKSDNLQSIGGCVGTAQRTKYEVTTFMYQWQTNEDFADKLLGKSVTDTEYFIYEGPTWKVSPYVSLLLPLAISALLSTGLYFVWTKKPKTKLS